MPPFQRLLLAEALFGGVFADVCSGFHPGGSLANPAFAGNGECVCSLNVLAGLPPCSVAVLRSAFVRADKLKFSSSKATVLRTGYETQLPQPGGVERLRHFFRRMSLPVRFDGGMFFE